MTRRWRLWLDFCEKPLDTRVLAALRISVAVVAIVDLLEVWRWGLVGVYYRTLEHGGLGAFSDPALFLDPAWMGPWAFGGTIACLICTALGVATRPAMFGALVLWAQIGHLYPPGDRAIDRILRTVLLFLLFSASHRRWALNRSAPLLQAPGWPLHLLRWLLVLVYLSAGISKLAQQPGWLAVEGTPVLYRILCDPLSARLDAVVAQSFFGVFRVMGWATIAVELGAVLLLTRWARLWATAAITMHLGVAWSMNLGMFSWGMITLYVPLLHTWWLPWLDRRRHSVVE